MTLPFTTDAVRAQCALFGDAPAAHPLPVKDLLRMCDELDRLRAHSVRLNNIGWRIAVAVGDVGPDDTECEADPEEQLTRLIAMAGDSAIAWSALHNAKQQLLDACRDASERDEQSVRVAKSLIVAIADGMGAE